MIELISTHKMLKVRNAMGYPVDHPNEKTARFFRRHDIELTKHWIDDQNTHVWSLSFPDEKAEFLFKLTYAEYL